MGVIYCNLYESHILGCASSVRAAQAFILRCEPHKLLSFAQASLILRSSFACDLGVELAHCKELIIND